MHAFGGQRPTTRPCSDLCGGWPVRAWLLPRLYTTLRSTSDEHRFGSPTAALSNPSLQLTRTDLVTLDDGRHEHPPISDFPGARRQDDRLHDVVNDVVRDDYLNLHLRQ